MVRFIFSVAVALLCAAGVAQAATFTCQIMDAYRLDRGKLDRKILAETIIGKSVVFDDATGQFAYGEGDRWLAIRMEVASSGSSSGAARGHALFEGSQMSAIYIEPWTSDFLWLHDAEVFTGTCERYGPEGRQ